MIRRPPRSPLFPYTTLSRSLQLRPRHSYRGRSFTRLVLNLINGFREAQEMVHRYEQLSHLSDVELAARNMRRQDLDRKSTRLNSSHQIISYAVFCLKKKNNE